PGGLSRVTPKAFLIGVGVDSYEGDVVSDLDYAAADARLILGDLSPRFEKLGFQTDEVALVSPRTLSMSQYQRPGELPATKGNIRQAIAQTREAARPDDILVLCFSSHGYTDSDGMFYICPHDLGNHNHRSIAEMSDVQRKSFLAAKCISSDELSSWLRDVDAAEIIMIVDTCHAAAAIEGTGDFKPGPMGSRGFGQLAYDKGMRILTASQAGDVALESNKVKQGLLTYALICDGLIARKADTDQDSEIDLTEWLSYAERRVPTLFEEIYSDKFRSSCNKERVSIHLADSARDYETKRRGDRQGGTIALPPGTPVVQTPRLFLFKRETHQGLNLLVQ
ncbi:MAG: caspase family protein, partial [Planctomycetota bacterium]